MSSKPPVFLTAEQVAERWGNTVSARTMERWRKHGKGPAYLKVGGRVVYRLDDVEAYEVANRKGQGDEQIVGEAQFRPADCQLRGTDCGAPRRE